MNAAGDRTRPPGCLPLLFHGHGLEQIQIPEDGMKLGKRQEHEASWRQGFSKRHKLPCAQCGGLLHAKGNHFSPGHVPLMLAKIERERKRAEASGYQAGAVQAG